jgi:hypothetical protein
MNAAATRQGITKVKKWSYFLASSETGPFLTISGGGGESPNSAVQVYGTQSINNLTETAA